MQANFSPIALEPNSRVAQTIRNWTLGQLFDVQVLARHSSNSVEIRVNGTTVRAATTGQFQPGDKLKLEVTQLRPNILLSPVRTAATSPADPVRLAINQALPKQRSLVPLLEALRDDSNKMTPANGRSIAQANEKTTIRRQAATASDGAQPRLLGAVKESAQNLLKLIPTLSSARNSALLAEIIQRAGIFFEATAQKKIASGQIAMPEGDLKLQLLRLRSALANSVDQTPTVRPSGSTGVFEASANKPSLQNVANLAKLSFARDKIESRAEQAPRSSTTLDRLVRMTEGALARIETNQLMAVNSRLDGELEFRLDIPIDIGGSYKSIEIKITQDDGRNTEEAQKTTTIAIEIPLTEASVLRAIVSQSVSGLAIRLWSPDAVLRQSIMSESIDLVDNLRARGVDNVTVALLEISSLERWTKKPAKLVDEKA